MYKNINICIDDWYCLFYLIVYIFSDHTDKVLCVQFNLDYIVSGSTDKTIKVLIKNNINIDDILFFFL